MPQIEGRSRQVAKVSALRVTARVFRDGRGNFFDSAHSHKLKMAEPEIADRLAGHPGYQARDWAAPVDCRDILESQIVNAADRPFAAPAEYHRYRLRGRGDVTAPDLYVVDLRAVDRFPGNRCVARTAKHQILAGFIFERPAAYRAELEAVAGAQAHLIDGAAPEHDVAAAHRAAA